MILTKILVVIALIMGALFHKKLPESSFNMQTLLTITGVGRFLPSGLQGPSTSLECAAFPMEFGDDSGHTVSDLSPKPDIAFPRDFDEDDFGNTFFDISPKSDTASTSWIAQMNPSFSPLVFDQIISLDEEDINYSLPAVDCPFINLQVIFFIFFFFIVGFFLTVLLKCFKNKINVMFPIPVHVTLRKEKPVFGLLKNDIVTPTAEIKNARKLSVDEVINGSAVLKCEDAALVEVSYDTLCYSLFILQLGVRMIIHALFLQVALQLYEIVTQIQSLSGTEEDHYGLHLRLGILILLIVFILYWYDKIADELGIRFYRFTYGALQNGGATSIICVLLKLVGLVIIYMLFIEVYNMISSVPCLITDLLGLLVLVGVATSKAYKSNKKADCQISTEDSVPPTDENVTIDDSVPTGGMA